MENSNQPAHNSAEVVGAYISVRTKSMMPLKSTFTIGLKAWDAKATRWIAAQYGLHASQLEALSIVYAYLDRKGWIDRGTNQQDIVCWSGARRKWQSKVIRNIADCVEQGVLQRVPFGRGFRVQITQKGLTILEAWVNRLNELNAKL